MKMKELMDFYRDKRVLVTGHTGFKGAWLCRILTLAGAQVTGYSLEPPTDPSLFEIAGLEDVMNNQWRTASEQCRTLQREKPQTMDGLMDFLQDQAVLGERISSFFLGACQLREQFPHF